MGDGQSLAEQLARLDVPQRRDVLAGLSTAEAEALQYDWRFWGRPDQQHPPGDWLQWVILAGRGWGKTRTGAETIRQWVCGPAPVTPGKYRRIALIAETAADARDVLVEGDSGILAVHPDSYRPMYEPSKRRLTWPNGAVATLYNATEPDQLRGPQHDAAWCDELAKWRYARETWDMLQFGLRGGDHPRQLITTTPRPIALLREILMMPGTMATKGRTQDNASNLAPSFLRAIVDRYAGTRLGRQELEAEILDDVPGALWTRRRLDELRVRDCPPLRRVVIAVDPAVSSGESAAEHGIIAGGMSGDQSGYVIGDYSLHGTPDEWARAAVAAYRLHQADRIVAEKNQGGEMVESMIRTVDPHVPVTLVHASRGKYVRAEPISALYEQGRIHHVGAYPTLEDQMCAFTPQGTADGVSPDRVDALVWLFTDLIGQITTVRRDRDRQLPTRAAKHHPFGTRR